jgi:protease PrsW
VDHLYSAPLLIFFGFIPSLAWLFYFIRKDLHPEPKSLIARTLMVGILIAPLAIVAELFFVNIFKDLLPNVIITSSAIFFVWVAFVEELVKYLAVRLTIINNPNFDEPTDAMVYMISAGLGFAAIENILVLFNAFESGVQATIQIWVLRFAGATLLHAVSSALLGYFLALSWFYNHHSKKIVAVGFGLAILAHYAFNISLMVTSASWAGFAITTTGLTALIVLILFLFRKLKKRMAEQLPN